MKTKLFLIIVSIVFLVSFVSAQITYEEDEILDLKIPFEVNGTIASSGSTCNISIQYPNGTYVRNGNNNMSNLDNGEFNITLTAEEMATVGNHVWVAACCDEDKCARGTGGFEITRTGKETPDNMPILFAVIILIIYGTSWFFLFLSLKLTEPGPKIFFMLASLIFLIGSIAVSVVFADDNNVTESVSDTVGALLFALGMIFIVVFFYVFIRQTVEVLRLMRIKKGIEMPTGEYSPRGPY